MIYHFANSLLFNYYEIVFDILVANALNRATS